MVGEEGQRVLAALQAEGAALPLVVLARRLSVPPSRLTPVLDDLYDEGLVIPGRERGTVALAPRPRDEGRFHSSAGASRAPR